MEKTNGRLFHIMADSAAFKVKIDRAVVPELEQAGPVRSELNSGRRAAGFTAGCRPGQRQRLVVHGLQKPSAGVGVPSATPVRARSSSSRPGEMEPATTEAQPIAEILSTDQRTSKTFLSGWRSRRRR